MKTEILSLEIRQLIIDALALEDMSASDIDENEALFGTGLGLDSIDALELGVALQKKFGVKLKANADADETKAHFSSVMALVNFVQATA